MINFDLRYPVILQTLNSGFDSFEKKLNALAQGYSHLCIDDEMYMEKARMEANRITQYIREYSLDLDTRMICIIINDSVLSSIKENESVRDYITRLVQPIIENAGQGRGHIFSIYLLLDKNDNLDAEYKRKIEEVKELNSKRNGFVKNVIFLDKDIDFFSTVFSSILLYAKKGFNRFVNPIMMESQPENSYNILIGQEMNQILENKTKKYHQSLIIKQQLNGFTHNPIQLNEYQSNFERSVYKCLVQDERNEIKNISTAISSVANSKEELFAAIPIPAAFLDKSYQVVFDTCYKSYVKENRIRSLIDHDQFYESIKKARKVNSIVDFNKHYFETCNVILANLKERLNEIEVLIQQTSVNHFAGFEVFWRNHLCQEYEYALLEAFIKLMENEKRNYQRIRAEIEEEDCKKREQLREIERNNEFFIRNFTTNLLLELKVKFWDDDPNQITSSCEKEIWDDFRQFKRDKSEDYINLLDDLVGEVSNYFNLILNGYRSSLSARDVTRTIKITGIENYPDDWYYLDGLKRDSILVYYEEKHDKLEDIYCFSEEAFEI